MTARLKLRYQATDDPQDWRDSHPERLCPIDELERDATLAHASSAVGYGLTARDVDLFTAEVLQEVASARSLAERLTESRLLSTLST